MTPAQKLLRRAQLVPVLLLGIYALILVLALVPAIQKELVFLHRIRFPLRAKYDNPSYYGLAPYKTRNVYLKTPDGETLGAWHVLPHSYYLSQEPCPPRTTLSEAVFDNAFASRPTILYFHGNAATRAAPHRIRQYMQMSTRLDCNVLAVDYRGFADSTGDPSQEGLAIDARTAWDWIAARVEKAGAGPADKQIVIAGHSLGTGVSSALAAQLADEGQHPRAVVLIAPYTSLPDMLSSYWIFGVVPLVTPLKIIPGAQEYFASKVHYLFNTTEALSRMSSPVLIAHAVDDDIIPNSHSANLFNTILAPKDANVEINEVTYGGWGTVRYAEPGPGRRVVWWEGEHGGHVDIGHSEGTGDLIAWVADL